MKIKMLAYAKRFLNSNAPALVSLLRKIRFFKTSLKNEQQIFTEYYHTNRWGDAESLSGPGSGTAQTAKLVHDLPGIFRKFGCCSVLDAPCGDFFWMRSMDLSRMSYIGADIVPDLIEQNNQAYGSKNVSFVHADLAHDALPLADLVFCRDMLVHLPNATIRKVLNNFKRSGAKYLFATNFDGVKNNIDIVAGDWRPMDLTRPPFNWPQPIFKYLENSTLGNGAYPDKYLYLWELAHVDIIQPA